MFDPSEIQAGMPVRTIDGEKLGKVLAVRDSELIVEKGFLRKHDFAVPLSDVQEVTHGKVFLNHSRDSLFSAPREIPPPPRSH